MIGKIARVIADKGFGFIHANGKDYFFHKSECVLDFNRLYGGEEVSFEEDNTNRKGPRANNVILLGRTKLVINPVINQVDCHNPKLITSACNPIGMSYWRNINQHKNDDNLKVVLSIKDQLTIFIINKSNLEVIDQHSLDINHTGEGCFFSAHQPNILYIPFDNYIGELNISDSTIKTVVETNDYKIWQAHSDYDELQWSMTLKNDNYDIVKWGIWRDNELKTYDLKGSPDECQIDKSGQWLLIKEDNYNRIIYLPLGTERIISNESGALGHSDNGFGYALGENDYSSQPGACDKITFIDGSHELIYSTGIWNMGYVSFTNAKPGASDQYCLLTTPTELIKVNLNGTGQVICNNLTQDQSYENRPKANLCPEGQFAVWTAFVDGSLNAYIVRI